MRVLCLHGSGSSARIMESQISTCVPCLIRPIELTSDPAGALRASLPASWEFDFIDAPHACAPAPELKSFNPGSCFHFFGEFTVSAMCSAVEYVREVVEEDGPVRGMKSRSQ